MMEKSFKDYKKKADKPAGISEKVINLFKIINLIERGEFPSLSRLAEETEVSERSIYRYLNIINFIIPILYDKKKGGYRFENDKALKSIPVTLEELALILALSDLTNQIGGTLKETFIGMLKKFNIISETKTEENTALKIHFPATVQNGTNWYKLVIEAIREKRKLYIKYHSINKDEVTERTIEPYRVFLYDGVWFIYAYCSLREDFRWFALDRIVELRRLKGGFCTDRTDKVNENLSKLWGIWKDKETKIMLKFSREVASIIERKPAYHSSEKRKIHADGSIELSFTLSGAEDIKWWIYSWIPHVEILSPSSLREQMKRDLEKMITRSEKNK